MRIMVKKIKLFDPVIDTSEKKAILQILKSGFWASGAGVGNVLKFENKFKKYIKSDECVAVNSGTAALNLALSLFDIKNKEVILPSLSFVSTAHCIIENKGIPVFVDVEPETLCIDPKKIISAVTKKTRIILPVHFGGMPCNLNEIQKIAKKYNLFLIEDASHAIGSEINGKKCGNFSDISVMSLHQRKNLCAGEGGIVISKNKVLDKRIYQLRSFGHKELSYNYRMTEFAASIARESLKKLDSQNLIRYKNALYLKKKLNEISGLKLMFPSKNCKSAFHKLAIIYDFTKFKKNIKFFIEYMNKNNVPLSKAYIPLHHHPNFNPKNIPARGFPFFYFKKKLNKNYKKQKFPITEKLCYKMLAELAIHPPVSKKNIDYFYSKIKKYFLTYKK